MQQLKRALMRQEEERQAFRTIVWALAHNHQGFLEGTAALVVEAYMCMLDVTISTIWVTGTIDGTDSSRHHMPVERFILV